MPDMTVAEATRLLAEMKVQAEGGKADLDQVRARTRPIRGRSTRDRPRSRVGSCS